jgi:adenosine deaminase
MKAGNGQKMNNAEETLSFFEAYYGGFDVLKTKQDYHDLAMHYFNRAAAMNVRYCELFSIPRVTPAEAQGGKP